MAAAPGKSQQGKDAKLLPPDPSQGEGTFQRGLQDVGSAAPLGPTNMPPHEAPEQQPQVRHRDVKSRLGPALLPLTAASRAHAEISRMHCGVQPNPEGLLCLDQHRGSAPSPRPIGMAPRSCTKVSLLQETAGVQAPLLSVPHVLRLGILARRPRDVSLFRHGALDPRLSWNLLGGAAARRCTPKI